MLRTRKLIIIMCFIILFNFSITAVFADDDDEEEYNENEFEQIVETSAKTSNEPILNSKAAIIFDRESKTVMWGKNIDEKRAMASTTKIMTAIVVLENSDLNDVVTISKKAAQTGGSRLKIKENDKITVNDLLYGLMLRSGNDAAVALSEHVGGSIENFALMMNDKAAKLGLKNTNFVTPHGLDNPMHYTTAYELAILTDYALDNEKFSEIVKTKVYNININGNTRQIYNTNELLGNLNGVDGVKTGFTGNAMRCLVTSCTRNDNQIISIVLGADTKKLRTSDSIKLIEYAYSNFERVDLEEIIKKEFENWKQINIDRIYINKAENKKLELKLSQIKNKNIPIKKDEEKDIKVDINCIYQFEAPIYSDVKIGTIVVKCNDKILETVDILTKNDIRKKQIHDYMLQFLENLSTCLDFYT